MSESTNKQKEKILVTSALPYANGSIHLGHLVGYIQTDTWVRLQRMLGTECYFICGDDAHGTPVMLRAEAEGVTAETLIDKMRHQHLEDFKGFNIKFDYYHSTHSDENRELVIEIYQRLKKADLIEKRSIEQLYDPKRKMFLPDRFIKGDCPKCHEPDQYGDGCEKCHTIYTPMDLINPFSTISGATPIIKKTEHLFFKLSTCEDTLKNWMQGNLGTFKQEKNKESKQPLQGESINKLDEWFESGLRDWDISRDAPYFGFPIPDEKDKFFYVWLDAPVGYMASFKKFCELTGKANFDDFWNADSPHKLYHFIGKDILYFHALFWPAVLSKANYRTPDKLFVHGFLTINGRKMSKSRGTFINARAYLDIKALNPEYLRYYYAAKLGNKSEDIDINLKDFVFRVNSNLVGKYANIASRTAGFIHKLFAGKLCRSLSNEASSLLQTFIDEAKTIENFYQQRQFNEAIRVIMNLADKANEYISDKKPWDISKKISLQADDNNQEDDKDRNKLHEICTVSINAFRLLTLFLKPVIPVIAEKVEKFLNIESLDWQQHSALLLNHKINKYKHLVSRIEDKHIDELIEVNRKAMNEITETSKKQTETSDATTISFEDFAKIDLRVAKIINAEHVEGADKLLKLTLDIGDVQKQVFAGIKSAYQPEQLIGRHTVMVANLAPRKMRFGVSEGMVLAAGPGGKDIWILQLDEGAKPGMKVQ